MKNLNNIISKVAKRYNIKSSGEDFHVIINQSGRKEILNDENIKSLFGDIFVKEDYVFEIDNSIETDETLALAA